MEIVQRRIKYTLRVSIDAGLIYSLGGLYSISNISVIKQLLLRGVSLSCNCQVSLD